ncbi:hypothetical protein ACFQ1T_02585 [Methylophilus glucosoxydans]|uniref:DUF485 domain-containing protein n=1 Tax=Methylophilus glucosoxydans TaxID=752553 RepID=A0ABW3GG96_9PROT
MEGSIPSLRTNQQKGNMRVLNRLWNAWKNRKKFASYAEMPTAFVAFFALSGFLVSGFYGFVLAKVVPEYLEVANKTPLATWGIKGWLLTAILGALGLTTWFYGSIAVRCNTILRERLFK